jgi:hypothetical protein
MLKVNPAVDELTEMVPEATVQVGCVVTIEGVAGIAGAAFTVTAAAALMHPLVFLAVRV